MWISISIRLHMVVVVVVYIKVVVVYIVRIQTMRLKVRSFPVMGCLSLIYMPVFYRRKIPENTVSFRKLLETSLSERVFTRPTYRKIIQFQGEFGSEIGPPHIWLNISAFPHILESPSSYMTLQLLHSDFPYIWGKLDFLFYQYGKIPLPYKNLAPLTHYKGLSPAASSPLIWLNGLTLPSSPPQPGNIQKHIQPQFHRERVNCILKCIYRYTIYNLCS